MATTTVHGLSGVLTSAAVDDELPIWDLSQGQYKRIAVAGLTTGISAVLAGAGLIENLGILAVGEGDGIDVGANDISVDVTEIIDTAYGLVANGNDIRVSLDADGGMEFNTGATRVKLPTNHGLSRTSAGLALGTPTTLTASTTNAVATTSHSHAITSTADGATNHSTLLASSSAGGLTLDSINLPVVNLAQTTVDVNQALLIVDPANATSKNFTLRVGNATFNGVRDTTYNLGFNNGADADTTLASVGIQWEDMYRHTPSLSRSEFIVYANVPSGLSAANVRPWQVNVEHQSYAVTSSFSAHSHTFEVLGAATTSLEIINDFLTLTNGTMRFAPVLDQTLIRVWDNVSNFDDVLTYKDGNRVQLGDANSGIYIPGDSEFRKELWLGVGNWDTLATKLELSTPGDTRAMQLIRSMSSLGAYENNVIAFEMSDASANGHNEVFRVQGNKRVGINDTTPDATLDIVTPDASAVAVLQLEQLDVSEEMIEFTSVAGAGNAIESVGGKSLTTTHWIKVTINGDVRYIPAGTIS